MVPRQQSETIRSELPSVRYGIPCLAADDMSQGIKGKLFTDRAMRVERRRSVSVWERLGFFGNPAFDHQFP